MRLPRSLRRPRALLALSLLLAGGAAAADPTEEAEGGAPVAARATLGAASILFQTPGDAAIRQDGVALGVRASSRTSERFGVDVNLTWGLTDWDRAREWIDAGNSAGAWTTEKIRQVAGWSQEGGDAQPLHFVGAIFAEAFLALTYVAVPVCYVGSAGGATSHVQVDVTGTVRSGDGPLALWAEGGLGAAGIPHRFLDWNYALGPVVGIGVDAGPLRIGGRVLWSPGGLNSSPRADDSLFTASLTLALRP